jgi:hypothetical protein
MVCTNKEELIGYLRNQLKTDRLTAWRALKRVYENQTADEQTSEFTKYDNGVGFTGSDSEFLSSLAKQLLMYGTLSDKQTGCLFRLMPKYARQIIEGSIGEGKIIHKYNRYFTTQDELILYETSLTNKKEG